MTTSSREVHSSKAPSLNGTPQLEFLTAFLTDKNVASITPSNGYVAEAICKQIDFDSVKCIVELGAGNGAITRHLLNNLSSSATLLAFETNEKLSDGLRQSLTDRRLTILPNDAAKIRSHCERRDLKPDVVVSGIPFSYFDEETTNKILREVRGAMNPQGIFVVYQTYLPPFWTSRSLRDLLDFYFDEMGEERVLRNIPPMRILTLTPRVKF